ESSLLWGTERVEDPYKLLGHALRKAVGVIARQQGRGLRAVARLAGAQQGGAQGLTMTPQGTPTLRHGVGADRRMSIAEAAMHHGRKSRSLRVDGYKRHGLRDLESRLMVAVGVTPANVPEASVPDAITTSRAAPQCTLREWPIDRASLASPLVQRRTDDLA